MILRPWIKHSMVTNAAKYRYYIESINGHNIKLLLNDLCRISQATVAANKDHLIDALFK